MHQSVVRLYYKYDLLKTSTSDRYAREMRQQYEYARDSLEQTKFGEQSDGNGGTYTGKNSKQELAEKLAFLIIELVGLAAFFYAAYYLSKDIESKKLMGN
jgi:ATP-dependent metalloprotease